ncbi:4-hydroxythreonine-4-phosphate dehydrogenase PdxA [Candidatus Pelagibacter sp.]|uniref:4-hydroxythreonine-4-phosphate dehydrogenase PdxA n=1 Tax=Candidatus Pelagibacter sp. TaxID=2024849 RepID=UPI003F849456
MNSNFIIVVGGEPNSIFSEIYIKSLNKIKVKKPLILITSKKIFKLQMKKLNFKKKIKTINYKKLNKYKLDNNSINLIDIKCEQKIAFDSISNKSNSFIKNSFNLAFKILKKEKITKFINGPISKKNFLGKRYIGMTEYISKKFLKKKTCMLIYNKNLSVCPITTHLPLKQVHKKVNKKKIEESVYLIKNFYNKYFKKNPKICILGLNPHCESILKVNEDEKIIKPLVKKLNKININIEGPYPADTAFLKNNRKKFDVIIGMYHDQVLTPIKTLFEYDAINITLGLPFLRLSPDHGPNEKMIGKNLSNPLSLIKAIKFLDNN